ncbi:hypothetical protein BHE74_00011613, partial [Ensete ventricosum]
GGGGGGGWGKVRLPERGELGEEERILLEGDERKLLEHSIAGPQDHRDRRCRQHLRRPTPPPLHLHFADHLPHGAEAHNRGRSLPAPRLSAAKGTVDCRSWGPRHARCSESAGDPIARCRTDGDGSQTWPPEREIGRWGDRGVEDPTIAYRHRRSGNWVERMEGEGEEGELSTGVSSIAFYFGSMVTVKKSEDDAPFCRGAVLGGSDVTCRSSEQAVKERDSDTG